MRVYDPSEPIEQELLRWPPVQTRILFIGFTDSGVEWIHSKLSTDEMVEVQVGDGFVGYQGKTANITITTIAIEYDKTQQRAIKIPPEMNFDTVFHIISSLDISSVEQMETEVNDLMKEVRVGTPLAVILTYYKRERCILKKDLKLKTDYKGCLFRIADMALTSRLGFLKPLTYVGECLWDTFNAKANAEARVKREKERLKEKRMRDKQRHKQELKRIAKEKRRRKMAKKRNQKEQEETLRKRAEFDRILAENSDDEDALGQDHDYCYDDEVDFDLEEDVQSEEEVSSDSAKLASSPEE